MIQYHFPIHINQKLPCIINENESDMSGTGFPDILPSQYIPGAVFLVIYHKRNSKLNLNLINPNKSPNLF
jgi:hypothetical protein